VPDAKQISPARTILFAGCAETVCWLSGTQEMGVVVRFGKVKALLRAGEWRSADLRLEESLNRTTGDWIRLTGGPPVDARDPDRDVAEEICRRRGGKILLAVPASGKSVFRSYVSRRQMSFDFNG